MSVIRLSKEFSFEMAHALDNYKGPCKSIHGHSYKLLVTVIGQPKNQPGDPDDGMLMDFTALKRIVKEKIIDVFDHSLVLKKGNALTIQEASPLISNLIELDYQPTSENLLIDFAARIRKLLPPGVKLNSLKLSETQTSSAEWHSSDN